MKKQEIKTEVVRIMDAFGMSGKAVAEAMNVSYGTFRNKLNDNNERNWFNQKNLDDLKEFIKTQAIKL